jgi:superfamily II DNA helicase RecQ
MASENELAQRLAAGLASLGKQGFRAGQEEAVRAALDKRDALVVLPTGGGKSLCYMLAAQLQTGARPAWVLASRRADKTNPAHAACLRAGLCVVVSPLRALMKDQVDNAPLPVAALTSDTGEALKQRLFAQLEGHAPLGIKCLLVSPEMLHVNQKLVNALARLARRGMLSLIAIDEAHCVVDWGAHAPLKQQPAGD